MKEIVFFAVGMLVFILLLSLISEQGVRVHVNGHPYEFRIELPK